MPALDSKLRRELEKTIVDARKVVVAGVEAKLRQLTVHEGKRGTHLSEQEAKLRNDLRAHGRQIGDRRNSQSGAQAIDRLVQECAYEQWHQMVFVRFLAENELLIEPNSNMALSMKLLRDLAEEEQRDPWQLGCEFAAQALPAIFRPDDPLLQIKLSRETLTQVEDLLEALPAEVFTAEDSLGWVYQFWQTEEKDRVNQAGDKITGQTLPAVTQLFTEHYMVLFLLHNTLGAWHAAKVLVANPQLAESAKDEAELRRAVALQAAGGYEFEYLRFVRTGSSQAEGDGDAEEPTGPWRPMGGSFEGWPKTAAELKVLDPCCGSGHFLVAAFELLVRLRMEEEGLGVEQAVDAVLRDNLFGLELDARCTQIAAFNLAMAAWKLASAKPLPPMKNIACSGIPLGNSRDDWMKSLKDALPGSDLGFQWGQLYDMFSQADTLGSLLNPRRFFGAGMLTDEQLHQLSSALTTAIASDPKATSEQQELAAAAQGLTRATELLADHYTLVITNVPYLGRGKQDKVLKPYLEQQYRLGRNDLATAFVLRCLEFCVPGGSTALVTPQNWLFLATYKKLRETLLNHRQWQFVARLGPGAFETISGHIVNVALLGLSAQVARNEHQMAGIDASGVKKPEEKAAVLSGQLPASEIVVIPQEDQRKNPDARILLVEHVDAQLLSLFADYGKGSTTGDRPRLLVNFWELCRLGPANEKWLDTPESEGEWQGRELVTIDSLSSPKFAELAGCWLRGQSVWGRLGVAVNKMNLGTVFHYQGEPFDDNVGVIVPKSPELLAPVWAYVESNEFEDNVRRIDQKLNVTAGTLTKVPFDIEYWKTVSAEKYPQGLPEPESDDPTQWLFHGRPEHSTAPLQVAVARLLGYRWPAELESEMRLSQRARDLVARCHELDEFVDKDGIVCLPSLRGEDPAADRLLRLLNAAGVAHTKKLSDWLRDHFFQEHCKLFHQRPFIWHIWDGHKDGFSALVNYHKLAGPTSAKLLESLTYSYLGDWITRQEAAVKNNESGADAKLIAAHELQQRLIDILHGEPPFDIFVRWKPLHEQPIGWHPDIDDGVRMNIRPFMAVDLSGGRKGAGVLRCPPKIKWTKDRGKEPKRPIEEFPWFWSWDEKTEDFLGGDKFTGERWNDCHYTIKTKQAARESRSRADSLGKDQK